MEISYYKGGFIVNKFLKIIVSFVLILTLVGTFTHLASAQTVTPGFYVKNEMKFAMADFIKGSTKEKKKILKTMLKAKGNGQFVTEDKVYSFLEAAFATDEDMKKLGTPIQEYIEKSGPLTNPSLPSQVEFKIISIE